MLASAASGLTALLLASLAAAQASESTCRTSNGSAPFDGMYREAARPQIHFSPSSGFMNDPNGMFVDANGTHHLYFQYNPNATVAGNQHWGHATSSDGYTWSNQPIALAPEREGEGIFSGSAVVDVNNTSGFFDDSVAAEARIVAIYTLNTAAEQTQDIAYSRDGGFTFTKYEGNPVISINSTQFRDPKVSWDAQAKLWVMAVAHTQSWEIGFYTSPDLKTWQERSRFSGGLRAYQYECPDLIEVPVRGGPHDGQRAKVLVVSVNPGAPLGGSVTQYFVGDLRNGSAGFDDFTFRANDTAVRFATWGKDEYAAQTFYDPADEGGAVGVFWVGNWQYAQAVPTANATQGWRSEQTLPRRMRLEWVQQNPQSWAYVLAQEPLSFGSLAGADLAPAAVSGNTTVALNGTGAFDVRALFSLPANATVEPRANLRIRTQGQGFLDVGADFAGDGATVYIDRRKAGTQWADTNHFFTDRTSASLMPVQRVANDSSSDGLVEVRVVVDRIVSEAYFNNGTSVAAVLTFWDNDEVPSFVDVTTSSSQLKLERLSVVPVSSGWKC